ncbi:MAG: C10 family peptidase, partial [Bacteroidales bacterium]|nr:C10 family peptidase [Bacteroidales bacterium]
MLSNVKLFRFLALAIIFLSYVFPKSLSANDDFIIMSFPPDADKTIWQHSTHDPFGFCLTWTNLAKDTIFEDLPPPYKSPTVSDTDFGYAPGCVPTALGVTMQYFLKHHPIYKKYQNEITSRNLDSKSIIKVDYNNPETLHKVIYSLEKSRSEEKYSWDKMPDEYTTETTREDIQKYVSPLLMDIGIWLGVDYEMSSTGEALFTWKRFTYNGENLLRDFGFDYSVQFGASTSLLLESINPPLWKRIIKTIIETNLDSGRIVELEQGNHAKVVLGYA